MRLEIGIDANDVEKLAAFWRAALGYKRGTGDGEPYLNLVPTDDDKTLPVVFLQKVPESKAAKNRLHLDIYTKEAQALAAKLLAMGATAIDEPGSDGDAWWQVLADPEGNEFCIVKEVN